MSSDITIESGFDSLFNSLLSLFCSETGFFQDKVPSGWISEQLNLAKENSLICVRDFLKRSGFKVNHRTDLVRNKEVFLMIYDDVNSRFHHVLFRHLSRKGRGIAKSFEGRH